MVVQPEPILRAARRWLELIPIAGLPRSRSLLTTHPKYSDITPTQYESALDWVEVSGLLQPGAADEESVVERLFEAALRDADWFADADLLVRGPEELPGDAVRIAEVLGLDPDDGYLRLTTLWGKVDAEQRARVGAAGEAALVDLLARVAGTRVDHVSLRNDGLGYDVDVNWSGSHFHLEVKSTTRRARRDFFVSRNEWEVSRRDRNWRLVHLRLGSDLQVQSISTVDTAWIHANVPRDVSLLGRWQSARLEPPSDVMSVGILGLDVVLQPRRIASDHTG